ncbi:phage tail protein [Shewanella algae]|uniref:phage tail protein n=1 Tax=Shewanella algae TaxID=38313 RepID=UPI001C56D155|nr:phage tail protein [Shewanella algae]
MSAVNWRDIADTLTKMPYWLARTGSELDKLRRAAIRFWQRVEDALAFPARQLDPMTAELELVHLLAWERDIERIPSESEQMYRTRVKYALPFAKGAGSRTGWEDMFAKLGMQHITIDERIDSVDWDVVVLQLLDEDVGPKQDLINYICRQYGRTTRRYQYSTIAQMPLIAPPGAFDADGQVVIARLSDNARPTMGLAVMDNDSQLVIAKLKQQ